MSADDNREADTSSLCYCASCGIAENDDTKLKNCTACYLVKYCGIKCQKDHRKYHKRACQKRAAELRDEILFKQPESTYLGDCPICCLPLSLENSKSSMYHCCNKIICRGCSHANKKRELEQGLRPSCPFCRHPLPGSDAELYRNRMKRVEANDPEALRSLGTQRLNEGDYKGAFEYWTKAAELGNVEAHYQLSVMYRNGHGVEKDKKKEVCHLEKAAIGGDPTARHCLGLCEWENGRYERAVKHFIIAANLGYSDSLANLMKTYKQGLALVSKEDFAATLRAHHAAVDAMKSPQREEAEEYDRTEPARFGGLGKK